MLMWIVMVFMIGEMHPCPYITMFSLFILEGPCRIILANFLLRITRRKGIYILMILSSTIGLGFILTFYFTLNFMFSVFNILNDFGGENLSLVKFAAGVLGKFFITVYFPVHYTYLNELNPTTCRQLLFGITASIGSLAGVVAVWMLQNVEIEINGHKFGYSFVICLQTFVVAHFILFLPGKLNFLI